MRRLVVFALCLCDAFAQDSCDVKALDESAKDILFFAGSGHEPNTKEALLKSCPTAKKSLKFTQDYADKCLTGMAQAMLKVFLEGAAAETTSKCIENHDRHSLYVKHVPCLLTVGDQLHKCNKVIAAVLETAKDVDIKQRIPQSCCFVSDYEDCVLSAVKKCGDESVKYARSVIEGYAGDLLNSVCQKWKHGSKECMGMPKLTPHSQPKYDTMVPPLIEALQSLG